VTPIAFAKVLDVGAGRDARENPALRGW